MDDKCDCWIECGEVTNSLFGRWIKNEKYKRIRALHNVTENEAIFWWHNEGLRQCLDIEDSDPSLTACRYFTLATN